MQISQVDDFAFSSLPALQMLDLAKNMIQHLSANTLYKTFEQSTSPSVTPSPPRRLIARVLNLHDNPLVCDEDLGWLVKWLRERPDMQISTPGAPPTSCAAPPLMRGVSLRSVDIREREVAEVSNTVQAEVQASRRRWPERTALPHATTTPHPLTPPMHSTVRAAAGTAGVAVAGVQHGPSSAHVADTSLAVLLIGGWIYWHNWPNTNGVSVVTFVLIGLFLLVLIFIKLFHHKGGLGFGGSSAVHRLSKSLRYNPSRSMSPSPPLPFLLRHGQSQQQMRGCSHQGGAVGEHYDHNNVHPISQLSWSRAVDGQGGGLGPAGSGLRSSMASSTSASSTRYSHSVDGGRGVPGRPYRVYYGDGTEEWRRTNRTLESHWKF